MNGLESADPNIQTAILEVLSEGLSAAVLLYDKNDIVVFASAQFAGLLSVPKTLLVPGTRMRDLLSAMYEGTSRLSADPSSTRRTHGREDWLAEQIAGLWKERSETLERPEADRWLSILKRRLPSGYGLCIVKDISEQKKREEQWRLDTERVQVTEEVLDNLPFPVTVKDRNSTFVAVNKAACDFVDLPVEAILGHKSVDVHPPELERRVDPINRRLLESGESYWMTETIRRPDGSKTVVVVQKYRIGKPGRYYVVTVKQDLSRLIEAKDDGIVPLVRRSDMLETDLSRDPAVSPQPGAGETEALDAKVLVVTASSDLERQAVGILGDAGIDVSGVSGPDELAMFLQLASDADIRIDLVAIDASMPVACREVAEAHGIPVAEVEPAHARTSLLRSVCTALQQAQHEALLSPSEDWTVEACQAEDVDILVAEDNEVNQIVFSQIIESLGYTYALAVDGEEAVRLWHECSPRLVLMDVTLPKLTGFEACAAIRGLETEGRHVPVVGVLAQAFDRDKEACFAAGMDDVILKPISPEALDAVIRRFLGGADAQLEPAKRPLP